MASQLTYAFISKEIKPGRYFDGRSGLHLLVRSNQSKEAMEKLMLRAIKVIPVERLWINPDCGLKTRGWEETKQALKNMVSVAKIMRKKFILTPHG
jgi:hypothetical protein